MGERGGGGGFLGRLWPQGQRFGNGRWLVGCCVLVGSRMEILGVDGPLVDWLVGALSPTGMPNHQTQPSSSCRLPMHPRHARAPPLPPPPDPNQMTHSSHLRLCVLPRMPLTLPSCAPPAQVHPCPASTFAPQQQHALPPPNAQHKTSTCACTHTHMNTNTSCSHLCIRACLPLWLQAPCLLRPSRGRALTASTGGITQWRAKS